MKNQVKRIFWTNVAPRNLYHHKIVALKARVNSCHLITTFSMMFIFSHAFAIFLVDVYYWRAYYLNVFTHKWICAPKNFCGYEIRCGIHSSANQSRAQRQQCTIVYLMYAVHASASNVPLKYGPLDCISAHAAYNDGNDDYEVQVKPGDKISAFVHNKHII